MSERPSLSSPPYSSGAYHQCAPFAPSRSLILALLFHSSNCFVLTRCHGIPPDPHPRFIPPIYHSKHIPPPLIPQKKRRGGGGGGGAESTIFLSVSPFSSSTTRSVQIPREHHRLFGRLVLEASELLTGVVASVRKVVGQLAGELAWPCSIW
ncbi:hypothetical protein B0J12DRAFT_313908 [Macrophomina phaseolina]|uniref:Uncharacterized protein n=1 Tax=Macrophomina phaseolina TaxID=35725 RepID=A0ABQ8FWH8_9PEZI|nr:hypothetical protein B0J12DRAFT_313908 [Macrophomina phaseolina]